MGIDTTTDTVENRKQIRTRRSVERVPALNERGTVDYFTRSGTISMASTGQTAAQIPQPLQ